MKIKPGYRTSEFWFTLVSFIFSGLYLTGLINDNTQKEELISTVSHAVESCILIGGQLVILYRYINARSEIKKEYPITPPPIETPAPVEPKIAPEPTNTKPKERKKNDKSNNKSRTDKTRSRKTNNKKQSKPK